VLLYYFVIKILNTIQWGLSQRSSTVFKGRVVLTFELNREGSAAGRVVSTFQLNRDGSAAGRVVSTFHTL
jgi:hypothetical protein